MHFCQPVLPAAPTAKPPHTGPVPLETAAGLHPANALGFNPARPLRPPPQPHLSGGRSQTSVGSVPHSPRGHGAFPRRGLPVSRRHLSAAPQGGNRLREGKARPAPRPQGQASPASPPSGRGAAPLPQPRSRPRPPRLEVERTAPAVCDRGRRAAPQAAGPAGPGSNG